MDQVRVSLYLPVGGDFRILCTVVPPSYSMLKGFRMVSQVTGNMGVLSAGLEFGEISQKTREVEDNFFLLDQRICDKTRIKMIRTLYSFTFEPFFFFNELGKRKFF